MALLMGKREEEAREQAQRYIRWKVPPIDRLDALWLYIPRKGVRALPLDVVQTVAFTVSAGDLWRRPWQRALFRLMHRM